MIKREIVEKVKINYECVLVDFKLYYSATSLYKMHKDDLNVLPNEILESALLEEKNVFKVENIWIYATEWYDAEYDD